MAARVAVAVETVKALWTSMAGAVVAAVPATMAAAEAVMAAVEGMTEAAKAVRAALEAGATVGMWLVVRVAVRAVDRAVPARRMRARGLVRWESTSAVVARAAPEMPVPPLGSAVLALEARRAALRLWTTAKGRHVAFAWRPLTAKVPCWAATTASTFSASWRWFAKAHGSSMVRAVAVRSAELPSPPCVRSTRTASVGGTFLSPRWLKLSQTLSAMALHLFVSVHAYTLASTAR